MTKNTPKDAKALRKKNPLWLKLIVTNFGTGLSPKAPGTVGTIGALIYLALIVMLCQKLLHLVTHQHGKIIDHFVNFYLILSGLVVVFNVLSYLAIKKYIGKSKTHIDPQEIVIDEAPGYITQLWLALPGVFIFPGTLLSNPLIFMVVNFMLFRANDILKPWPVNWIDQKVEGAKGILFDDIVAGIMGAVDIYILLIVISEYAKMM